MNKALVDTFETTAELERELLAALFVCPDDEKCAVAYAALVTEDFHDPAHRKAWTTLHALHDRTEPPTVATALAEAERHDWQPKAAREVLAGLCGAFAAPWAIPWLCRHIRERRRRREILALGEDLVQVAAGRSSADVSADAQARLAALADLEQATQPRTAREWIVEKGFEAPRGVVVAWPKLADILRQWWDGWLYVVGGRPSQGKTALCVNVALRAAERGVAVCIESLEMSGHMLVDRLAAMVSGVSISRQLESGLREHEIDSIGKAHQDLAGLPLTIHAGVSHRLEQLLARVRAWRLAVAGDGPALVVVDYVGLVDAGKRRDGDQVSATSKALKALATQLRLPVLLCAQLNRGVEMREDLRQKKRGKTAAAAAAKDDPQRPRLSDLRDSGSLEQDADAVLFLYGMERGKSGWCKIAVEKQRQGPTGDAMLWFEAGLTRFQGEEHG